MLFSCDEAWHLAEFKYIRENEFPSPIFPQLSKADRCMRRRHDKALYIHTLTFLCEGATPSWLVPRWRMENIRLMTTFPFVSPRFLPYSEMSTWDSVFGTCSILPLPTFLENYVFAMQIRQRHNRDRHPKSRHEGNGSQYNKRKPQKLSHTYIFKCWIKYYSSSSSVALLTTKNKKTCFAWSDFTNVFVHVQVFVFPFPSAILWRSVSMCGFLCVSETKPSISDSPICEQQPCLPIPRPESCSSLSTGKRAASAQDELGGAGGGGGGGSVSVFIRW